MRSSVWTAWNAVDLCGSSVFTSAVRPITSVGLAARTPPVEAPTSAADARSAAPSAISERRRYRRRCIPTPFRAPPRTCLGWTTRPTAAHLVTPVLVMSTCQPDDRTTAPPRDKIPGPMTASPDPSTAAEYFLLGARGLAPNKLVQTLQLHGHTEEMEAQGLRPGSRLISAADVPAPPEVAAFFGLAP